MFPVGNSVALRPMSDFESSFEGFGEQRQGDSQETIAFVFPPRRDSFTVTRDVS